MAFTRLSSVGPMGAYLAFQPKSMATDLVPDEGWICVVATDSWDVIVTPDSWTLEVEPDAWTVTV